MDGSPSFLALHGFLCHQKMHMNMVTEELHRQAQARKKVPTGLTLLRSSFARKKGKQKTTAAKESEDEILISLIRLALLSHMKLPLFVFSLPPSCLSQTKCQRINFA